MDFGEIQSQPNIAPQSVTANCGLTSRITEIELLYNRLFIFTDFWRALEDGGTIPVFASTQLECDIYGSVRHDIIYENDQQEVTV